MWPYASWTVPEIKNNMFGPLKNQIDKRSAKIMQIKWIHIIFSTQAEPPEVFESNRNVDSLLGRGCASVVEHLVDMYKIPGSISGISN